MEKLTEFIREHNHIIMVVGLVIASFAFACSVVIWHLDAMGF